MVRGSGYPQEPEPIVFHILNTADGLTATLQTKPNVTVPVTSVSRTGSQLKMEIKAVGARFEGTISPDLKTLIGNFTLDGGSVPMVLKR